MTQEDNEAMDPVNDRSKKKNALRLRVLLGILGALALIATTTGFAAFVSVGKWLVREDSLQPASAIAVLSGGIPTRALEAAALYHAGYSKEIWLTHPDDHGDPLKELGINPPSEDEFNIRVLRRAGVPAKAIRVLETPIVNTDEELDEISAALQAKGGGKVIIVTNKSHTRRVHILWTKFFGSRGVAVIHALPDDDYAGDRWWRDPGSMTQVSHEVFGILNVWAGLPVQRINRPSTEVVAEGPAASSSPAPSTSPTPGNAD
jgi:uncharacterized SAM-binding protein YcdF (DUF218 family)